LFSCNNDEKVTENFINSDTLPVEEMLNSTIIYTENGDVRVKIVSSKMTRYIKPENIITFSEGVKVDFYTDSTNKKSVLTSQNASVNNKTHIMTATDNVKLLSYDNKELLTEELIWDQKNNLIYTEREVKITTEDEVIYGVGFSSTPDFTEYEIKKAKGSFNLKKD
jgi:LPS export ABC transporter protein LptC